MDLPHVFIQKSPIDGTSTGATRPLPVAERPEFSGVGSVEGLGDTSRGVKMKGHVSVGRKILGWNFGMWDIISYIYNII